LDKINRSNILTVFGVIIAGCLLIWQAADWRGRVEDEILRSNLLRQAEAIARSINPNSVKALSFNSDDKDNPLFQRLRGHMKAYGQILNVRGLYSMAIRNGSIVFGPENYAEEDPQASPPGAVHEQPSENVIQIFKDGLPFIEGPETDEYGTFISALAPVLDPRTGEVLMIVGLDIEADDWQAEIYGVQRRAAIYATGMFATLGGLIFLVLRRRRTKEPKGLLSFADAYLVGAIAIFVTFISATALHDNESVNRREVFALMADAHSTSLQQGFNHLENCQIGSITRFMEGSDQVEKNEFLLYVSHLLQHGSIRFVQWVPKVPSEDKNALEKLGKVHTLPNFGIWRQADDGTRMPASLEQDYYPVWFVAPPVGLDSFLGYDINSNPDLHIAIEKVTQSGLPTCAGPTILPPDRDRQPDLVILSPVFSVIEERRPLLGFVLAAISPQNFMRISLPSLSMTDEPHAVIQVYQLEAGQAPRILVSSSRFDQRKQSVQDFMAQDYGKSFLVYPVFFLDRTLAVVVHLGPTFLKNHPELVWKVTLVIGLLLTLALTSFAVLVIRGRRDLEIKVRERTAELSQSEQRLDQLNQCLLNLETDSQVNISSLVTCCGNLVRAASATYYRVEDGVVFSNGKYALPVGFKPDQKPNGHICLDVITNDSELMVSREIKSETCKTTGAVDDNCPVKTYMAAVVHRNCKPYGSICVMFEGGVEPSNDDKHIIQIIASAIGGEEDRAMALDELQLRQAFEHELLEVSGRFINITTAETDAAIEDSLGRIGSFCKVDRSYVFLFDHRQQTMGETHEWRSDGIQAEQDNLQDIPLSELPALMEALSTLEIVHIPNVSQLTDTWKNERELLKQQGTLSLVVVPMEQSERLIGFVGFDSVKRLHEWETWQFTMLRIFADRLSGALERKRVEEERNKLEVQLFQAQKLESIGTLAGGIAHDFNNLLQIIQGFAEVLLMKKKETDLDYNALMSIMHAAQSGADLVLRILAFGRKSKINPEPLDLNKQVEQAGKLLSRTIPKTIDVEERLEERLALVNADTIQIEQILMNLALNAVDAMPEGGKLTIETKNVMFNESLCEVHLDGNPSDLVELSISDTGQGMETETLKHMFEPFFTTKGVGRGTGLGLSVVYGIVKQHGGDITCESELGKGTTFKIYLPVSQPQAKPKAPIEDSGPYSGTETILLVDDEEDVRNCGKIILEDCGYTVLTALNGQDALNIYKQEMNRISLVILDLIMPELDGSRCIRELLKINPELKVLIQSGVASGSTAVKSLDLGARGFVRKPYRVSEFLNAVGQILREA
jgi:signal transduction histidine kinase/CHASE1-domain containing sensor protein